MANTLAFFIPHKLLIRKDRRSGFVSPAKYWGGLISFIEKARDQAADRLTNGFWLEQRTQFSAIMLQFDRNESINLAQFSSKLTSADEGNAKIWLRDANLAGGA